jgi:hypothetical protein
MYHAPRSHKHVPANTAENGNGRAARTDGDVQVRDIDTEELLDEASGDTVDRIRVLDILAALGPARGTSTRATGRDGSDGRGEGEGGDDELGEHGA